MMMRKERLEGKSRAAGGQTAAALSPRSALELPTCGFHLLMPVKLKASSWSLKAGLLVPEGRAPGPRGQGSRLALLSPPPPAVTSRLAVLLTLKQYSLKWPDY